MKHRVLFYISSAVFFLNFAHAQTLEPFKDELFKHGQIIETRDDGAFIRVDYDEMRDVNGRDEIPVQRAQAHRVNLDATKEQREISISYKGQKIETYEVGTPKDAKFAVIFIHGGGGNKTLGANDWTFGGNFNRIKNLAVQNHGVYYSPSVTFDKQGVDGVAEIINQIKVNSPQAKIVVACGSAGGDICWGLADDKNAVSKLAGLVLLGTASGHPSIERSEAYKATLPILYAHGSRDICLAWETLNRQFEQLRKSKENYPTRFILFNKGIHGTPIRMIDWRETLKWIFSHQNSKSTLSNSDSPAVIQAQQISQTPGGSSATAGF